jgi:hypothetical protein
MVLTEVSGRETETQYKPTYSFVNGVTPLSPKTGRLTEYNVGLDNPLLRSACALGYDIPNKYACGSIYQVCRRLYKENSDPETQRSIKETQVTYSLGHLGR